MGQIVENVQKRLARALLLEHKIVFLPQDFMIRLALLLILGPEIVLENNVETMGAVEVALLVVVLDMSAHQEDNVLLLEHAMVALLPMELQIVLLMDLE